MGTVIWRSFAVLVILAAAVAAGSVEKIYNHRNPPFEKELVERMDRHLKGIGVEYDSVGTGPFGLWMGMRVADFPEDAAMRWGDNNYLVYVVPKPNRDIDSYLLRIDPRFGLYQIIAYKTIADEEDGKAQLRPWFYRFVNALDAVYGSGKCAESIYGHDGSFIRNDETPPSTQPPADPQAWCTEVSRGSSVAAALLYVRGTQGVR